MTTVKAAFVAVPALFVLLAAAGCSARRPLTGAPQVILPQVTTAIASKTTISETISVSGSLGPLPGDEATVVPQVSGSLLQLFVTLGSDVERGETVAQISPQLQSNQVIQEKAVLGQCEVQEQQAEANALEQRAQTQSAILLASANVRSAQAALAGDKATLIGDKAAIQNANRSLARTQTLYAEGLVAMKDVDDAQLALQTAASQEAAQEQAINAQMQTVDAQKQALAAALSGRIEDIVKRKDIDIARQQVINARAALAAANVQEALYTLHAPISGRVMELGASVGETVDSSTKILTVADLHRLQLTMNVPGDQVSKVARGQVVVLTSTGGRALTTKVQAVSQGFDTTSGTVPVLATIDNIAGQLKDDQTVSATIIIGSHTVVVAPQAAIITDPVSQSPFIAIISNDNHLHLTPVTTGQTENGMVEITSGLNSGERIAVSGAYGLGDGSPVAPTPVQATQAVSHGP